MVEKNYDDIADTLLSVMSLLKKIEKQVKCDNETGLFTSHYGIIFLLDKIKVMPMSEFSEKLALAKPRVTLIVNRLVDEGLVERLIDESDRRIVNISLTESGNQLLKTIKHKKRNNLRALLTLLKDDDLKQFIQSLQIVNVLSKEIYEKSIE